MKINRLCKECGSDYSVTMPIQDIEKGLAQNTECPCCKSTESIPTVMDATDGPSVWDQQ